MANSFGIQIKMKQSGHAMKKNTVIFDLDGTLANIEVTASNKSLKPNDKMDWDVFFDCS